jgi:hypothetical protein
MAADEMVKLPKAMLDNLEDQVRELAAIKQSLTRNKKILMPYLIKAVVTTPPSGRDALAVLSAVEDLVSVAVLYGDKNG